MPRSCLTFSGSSEPLPPQQEGLNEKRKHLVCFDLNGTSYELRESIGTGAYGIVASAVNRITNTSVAIKKIANAFNNSTIAKRTLREMRILRHLNHENIIGIRDMFCKSGSISLDVYIVLDLMESDMHQIIHSKQPLTDQHLQYFLYQILRGLKFIHSANIIHRDLKPSNLMVNSNCLLKIGDFGMARSMSDPSSEGSSIMTQYVATRWYRAPELLLSILDYATSIDIWSAGCIFAEMLLRRQLFPGKDHLSQLKLIIYYLGTPPASVMDEISSELVKNILEGIGRKAAIPWNVVLPKATKPALSLISQMLRMEHLERISAAEALKHCYLEQYHDSTNEPTCPVFMFDKDYDVLSRHGLQDEIEREIRFIHDASLTNCNERTTLADASDAINDRAVALTNCAAEFQSSDVAMLSARLDDTLSLPGVCSGIGTSYIRKPQSIGISGSPSVNSKHRETLLVNSRCTRQKRTSDDGENTSEPIQTGQVRHLARLQRGRKRFEKSDEKEPLRRPHENAEFNAFDRAENEAGPELRSKQTQSPKGVHTDVAGFIRIASNSSELLNRQSAVPIDYFDGDATYFTIDNENVASPCSLAPSSSFYNNAAAKANVLDASCFAVCGTDPTFSNVALGPAVAIPGNTDAVAAYYRVPSMSTNCDDPGADFNRERCSPPSGSSISVRRFDDQMFTLLSPSTTGQNLDGATSADIGDESEQDSPAFFRAS